VQSPLAHRMPAAVTTVNVPQTSSPSSATNSFSPPVCQTAGSGSFRPPVSKASTLTQQVSPASMHTCDAMSMSTKFRPAAPNPNEASHFDFCPSTLATTQISQEMFVHIHNTIAMPMMRRPHELGRGFWTFTTANEIYLRLHGMASGEALYNAACCLSLGIEEQFRRSCRSSGGDVNLCMGELARVSATANVVAPDLPPKGSYHSMRALVEARLDLAIEILRKAVEAGSVNIGLMQIDTDMKMLRECRPTHFQSILQMASRDDKCAVPEPFGSRASSVIPPPRSAGS